MNFKKIVLLLLLAALLFIMGCQNKETATANIVQENSPTEAPAVPERVPDLMGRVKEVIGNEVTIIKMDPALGQRIGQRGNSDQQRETNDSNQPQPGDNVAVSNQGQKPQNIPTQDPTAQETEPFIIPVGTPIVMMQRGNTNPTIIDLTEIKKDQILRVWKYEGYVEFVQVLGGIGSKTGTTGNGQRNSQGGSFPGVFPGGLGGGTR
ncbi:MAG: hypothetical protein ACOYVD_00865 [Bacillota bacterium]